MYLPIFFSSTEGLTVLLFLTVVFLRAQGKNKITKLITDLFFSAHPKLMV